MVRISWSIFIIFLPMETGMNTPQSHVIYLLNCLYDVINVTCRKSRQFNFCLHAKINHIEFEDKFLIKPCT